MLWIRIGITLLFLMMGIDAFPAPVDKTVTLVTSSWVPYVINDDKQHGYAYDVVKAAFETQGYKVIIKLIPWETAMETAQSGQVDGIFPMYYTLARTKYYEYSKPFLAGPLVLYKRANSAISLKNLDPNNLKELFQSLKQYRFGIVKGYANVPDFDNNNDLTKIEAINNQQNLENLYDGKVDLILIDKLNAQYILRYRLTGKYNESLVPLSPALRENNIHVAFSKAKDGVHDTVEAFNKGLLKLQQEQGTTKIMSNYIQEFIDKEQVPNKIKSLNNF